MTIPLCRERESKHLNSLYDSKEAEFIAIYGRRRVGKTFLVRQLFQNRGIYFELMGKKDAPLHEQLQNFADELSRVFFSGAPLKCPDSWREAFVLLTKQINEIPKNKKITIFLDELPWLASKRSNLIGTLEYYWNAHWSKLKNLKLIVCGSAATWMLDNIINAKGGLHNRITDELLLKPFNLGQTKRFLNGINLKYSDKQVLDIYLIMGGVPYYLKSLKRSKSLTQNIQDICFSDDGALYKEFPRLFKSLFENYEHHVQLIRAISTKRFGLSYDEIAKATNISSGGGLSRRLNELEKSGFIRKYIPYGGHRDKEFYRVIDEYSLFYLRWIEQFYKAGEAAPKNFWALTVKSPSYYSWAGYSFEMVCHKHSDQILSALGIDNVLCKVGYWRFVPEAKAGVDGAQIDLLLDRADGVITLVEIKYSASKFSIDKNYARKLANKLHAFAQQTKTKKQINLVMLTTCGLKRSIWTEELVDNDIELIDFI